MNLGSSTTLLLTVPASFSQQLSLSRLERNLHQPLATRHDHRVKRYVRRCPYLRGPTRRR